MNYEEMSDFDISRSVGDILNIYWADLGKNYNPLSAWIDGKLHVFDPCNSWSDAGPIIQGRGISLYHDDGNWQAEMTFLAPTGKYGLEETASKVVWNKKSTPRCNDSVPDDEGV